MTEQLDMDGSLGGYLASMEGTVCSPLQLIELTKLLGAGNPVLNQLYLKLTDTTVGRCYETRTQLEECRQLIWLVFSHPAFSASERATLLHWVDLFDRLFPSNHFNEAESGYSSGGSDRSSSCSPSPTQDKMFVYNPSFLFQFPPPPPPAALAQTALPPHCALAQTALPPHCALAQTALPPHCRRNNGLVFKRSQSEPGHVGGNYMGTRCKMQHRERAIDVTSHMTALMSWLKTLRLHKYYPKLSAMGYHDMITLDETTLGDITEGARRKILLNIQKLSGRYGLLQDIVTDLSKPGRFNPCVTELHNMLMKTPFRLPPSSPLSPVPDLTWQADPSELIVMYTTVLETAGNIILANNIEEDSQKLFFKLLEDAAQHAALPTKQRRVVCEILQQCIDNYNYRYGQVIQPKRFDMTSFPHSVKIKYPIKPINGISHQSSGGYSGYNKFHSRQPKPNYQCRSSNGHVMLGLSHSAPVAPPSFTSPFNNIWSPTGNATREASPPPTAIVDHTKSLTKSPIRANTMTQCFRANSPKARASLLKKSLSNMKNGNSSPRYDDKEVFSKALGNCEWNSPVGMGILFGGKPQDEDCPIMEMADQSSSSSNTNHNINHTPFDFSAETLVNVKELFSVDLKNVSDEKEGNSTSFPSPSAANPDPTPFKSDNLDYVGLESLCSQIAECALAEK